MARSTSGTVPEGSRVKLREPGEIGADPAHQGANGKVGGNLFPRREAGRQPPKRLIGRQETAWPRNTALGGQPQKRLCGHWGAKR